MDLGDIVNYTNQLSLILIDTCMSGHLGEKNQNSSSWVTASRGYKGELSDGYLTTMIASYLTTRQWTPSDGNACPNWYFNKNWKDEFRTIGDWLITLKWTYNADDIYPPYRKIDQ